MATHNVNIYSIQYNKRFCKIFRYFPNRKNAFAKFSGVSPTEKMVLQNFLATVPFLVYNSYQQNYYNDILSYLSKNYIIRGAYDNAT